jgi:hypothetical protein
MLKYVNAIDNTENTTTFTSSNTHPNPNAMSAPFTTVVRIAEMMQLNPHQAVALPAAIATGARMSGMNEWRFANLLLENSKLRDYVASICQEAVLAL